MINEPTPRDIPPLPPHKNRIIIIHTFSIVLFSAEQVQMSTKSTNIHMQSHSITIHITYLIPRNNIKQVPIKQQTNSAVSFALLWPGHHGIKKALTPMILLKMMAKAGWTPPLRMPDMQPIRMYFHSGAFMRIKRVKGALGRSSFSSCTHNSQAITTKELLLQVLFLLLHTQKPSNYS